MGIGWKLREMRNERKFRRQRAKKGYADCDLWGIDDWFLNIIPKMLRDLKEYKDSYPTLWQEEWYEHNKERCINAGINDDNFYILETADDKTEEQEKLSEELSQYQQKTWNDILDRMIFLFEESDEDKCSMKNPYYDVYHEKVLKPWGDRFFNYINDVKKDDFDDNSISKRLFDPNDETLEQAKIRALYMEELRKIDEYREQCEKEAFELFSKYLHNLWL